MNRVKYQTESCKSENLYCEDEFFERKLELDCKSIGCWNDMLERWNVHYGIKTYKDLSFSISLEFMYNTISKNSRYYDIILFYFIYLLI